MTTETESLEALHLWLATELPELGRECPCLSHSQRHRDKDGVLHEDVCATCWNFSNHRECYVCLNGQVEPQGWVPNVTTDALLEALASKGLGLLVRPYFEPGAERHRGWFADLTVAGIGYEDFGFLKPGEHSQVCPTAHEALCRAARKALEAAS